MNAPIKRLRLVIRLYFLLIYEVIYYAGCPINSAKLQTMDSLTKKEKFLGILSLSNRDTYDSNFFLN
jgi:hypothetical protein